LWIDIVKAFEESIMIEQDVAVQDLLKEFQGVLLKPTQLPLVKALDHKIPLVPKVRHTGHTRVFMRIKRRLKIDEGNVVQWINSWINSRQFQSFHLSSLAS